jgi:TPR repeat protein
MPPKAIAACTKECEKGDQSACSRVEGWKRDAEDYVFEKVSRDAHRVYRTCRSKPGAQPYVECKARCDGGDAGACLKLGLIHEFGFGFNPEIDRDRARAYFAQACALYDENRYNRNLMPMHVVYDKRNDDDDEEDDGAYEVTFAAEVRGCARDRARGESLEDFAVRCAADCWAAEACDRMLTMDCLVDVNACEQACALGDAAYCRQLYVFHRDGVGVPKNAARAEGFRSAACKLEDRWSCNRGNRIYAKRKPFGLAANPSGVAEKPAGK